MSHDQHSNTQHNPHIPTDAELKAAAKKKEEDAKAQRKADRDAAKVAREAKAAEEERKKLEEKEAKRVARQAVLEKEEAERIAAREAKKAETAKKRDEKTAAKKAEAATERNKKREAKAAQKVLDDAAKVEERKKADAQRALDKEEAAKKRAAEIEAEKEARKQLSEERAQWIAARKAENASPTGRRQKSHFIKFNGLEGAFSKPQEHSIRGKVLATIVNHVEPGQYIAIGFLAALAKPVLYGTSLRAYLSKLEETNHIDFAVALPEGSEEVAHAGEYAEDNSDENEEEGVNTSSGPVDGDDAEE